MKHQFNPLRSSAVWPLLLAVAILGFVCTSAVVAVDSPGWWSARHLLGTGPADDYAALNQGQLKNMALAACDEFKARLSAVSGGAGAGILDVESQLTVVQNGIRVPRVTSATEDYAAATVGQLKALAKPFYDRLIGLRVFSGYPWSDQSDDNAVVNVGQAKRVFSYDFDGDTDGDGLSDIAELTNHLTNPGSSDSDVDGLSDSAELALGINPNSADSDGDTVSDGQDAFPDDPRRSEEIPVQRYIAVDFVADVFGPDYGFLYMAIDDDNRVGLAAVKHDVDHSTYKYTSWKLSDGIAAARSATQTITTPEVIGNVQISKSIWAVNASGTAIGQVGVNSTAAAGEPYPSVPSPYPGFNTYPTTWSITAAMAFDGDSDWDSACVYDGIKNTGLLWGRHKGSQHFVGGTKFDQFVARGEDGGYEYDRALFDTGTWDATASSSDYAVVSSTGVAAGILYFRSDPSLTSPYDLWSTGYWDGSSFRRIGADQENRAKLLAVAGGSRIFGIGYQATPPYTSPNMPNGPHPYLVDGSATTDFYLQLPESIRNSVRFDGTSWALYDDGGTHLVFNASALDGPNYSSSYFADGTFVKAGDRLFRAGGVSRPGMINSKGLMTHGTELMIPVEIRAKQIANGPHRSPPMYAPPQPLDGQPLGDLFSVWKNEKVSFVLGEPIAGMVQRNELPVDTVKWTGDEVPAKENVPEYEVQWATVGMKLVHLTIGGVIYNLHVNVPDTGSLNRDDDLLLQKVGILAMGTVFINGVSARDRVQLKYGVDAANGDTRQDAIRHSTWNAISAQAVGEEFTRLVTTANEHTGQFQGRQLSSNCTMDLHNNGVGIDAGKVFTGVSGPNVPNTTDDWIARMELKFDAGELWAWTPPDATVSTHSNILRMSNQVKIFQQ